jgi:GTPase Era involved in 16S rRNA processing
MKFRENPIFEAALRDAMDTVRLLRSSGAEDLASSLELLVKSSASERFVIGVIGATNRGKSTLINGLLGRSNDDCAPIGKMPATNVISIFGQGPSSQCKVCFHDHDPQSISESEIRLYATEQHNPANRKNVRSIELVAPFAGLEPNVFLVDTPGAGNALELMHNEVLLGFLPNADAVVFLVTAEDPLTESELNLLRAVQSKDIKKLFFAINMIDRVASGDLDPDALAEGIEHNRKALTSIGITISKFYTISAKNFFEKHADTGTDELARDIRQTINSERISIIVQKLQERTRSVLESCEQRLSMEIQEAKCSEVELRAEVDSLKKAQKELSRGRTGREAEFRKTWASAFGKLADDLAAIRKQLQTDYGQLIEGTSTMKLGGLQSTIHADVAASFGELLSKSIGECEGRIVGAQRKLCDEVHRAAIHVAPDLPPTVSAFSGAKNAFQIGLSTMPSLLTGTVAANLPGIIGGMILGAAPTIATAVWWNPLTWAAVAATGAANAAVNAVGYAVTGSLAVIATPVSILAFGISAYRLVDTWRAQQSKTKNELAQSVRQLIEEAYQQVQGQLREYRDADSELLDTYQKAIEAELISIEDRLEQAILHRPDEFAVQALEDKHRSLSSHRSKLLENGSAKGGSADGAGSTTIIDSLITKL